VSEFGAGDLRAVDIDNAAGPVRVVGVEDSDTITVTARISDGWRSTGHDVRREGDRLVIDGTCPFFLSEWCSVRYTIEMPSDLSVTAVSDEGRVTVTDIAGDVEASSDNGRIELARIEGNVVLHSDNGSVTATAIRRASRAEATSDNGAVRLEFLDPPDDVIATSDNGSIDVVLPNTGELYQVDAHSDNGTVSTGGVGTRPGSDRTITAESDNGDVTITYALD
jgi:Putative adhesin